MREFLLGAVATLVIAGAVQAQTRTLTSPVTTTPNLNYSTANYDGWSVNSLHPARGRMLKAIDAETDRHSWSRARQAAIAINDGRCADAVAVAMSANDAKLLRGIQRVCKGA